MYAREAVAETGNGERFSRSRISGTTTAVAAGTGRRRTISTDILWTWRWSVRQITKRPAAAGLFLDFGDGGYHHRVYYGVLWKFRQSYHLGGRGLWQQSSSLPWRERVRVSRGQTCPLLSSRGQTQSGRGDLASPVIASGARQSRHSSLVTRHPATEVLFDIWILALGLRLTFGILFAIWILSFGFSPAGRMKEVMPVEASIIR